MSEGATRTVRALTLGKVHARPRLVEALSLLFLDLRSEVSDILRSSLV
jgi:hypothetical protein